MINNDDFKGDKYFTLSEQVEGVIIATKLGFSQIETDLEEFNRVNPIYYVNVYFREDEYTKDFVRWLRALLCL